MTGRRLLAEVARLQPRTWLSRAEGEADRQQQHLLWEILATSLIYVLIVMWVFRS